jgi:hypothetical protein
MVITNITVFCNVIPYSTVDEYWHFRKTHNAHCCLAVRGIRFLCNTGQLLPYYKASCPSRKQSSVLPHCIIVNMNLLCKFFCAISEFSIKFFDPVVVIIFIYLYTRYKNRIILHVWFSCYAISFTSFINLCDFSCFVPLLCAYNIYLICSIIIIVKVIYKRNKIW